MLIFATQKQIKEMKGKYCVILILLITLFTGFFSSCGKDRWELYKPYTSQSIWIDSVMRENYLWNDELTDEDELTSSYFLNSVAFLQKVKFSSDNVSYVDTICSKPAANYGYELILNQVNDTAYMAVVTYVEPVSPAASAGLQRGEWIMGVDGSLITSDTQDLLTDGEAHTLAIGYLSTMIPEDSEEEQTVIIYQRDASLPAAVSVFTDDLPVVAVINNEIGYMLYNDIAAENQQKVAAASQALASRDITDLVLDLRFATTGDVSGFQYLASIVAPSSALGTTLAQVQYAESRHIPNALPFLTANELGNGVNLNLNTLYILTNTTAGPAEMLINCLRQVMNVVVIGQKTQGIAVACESFYDPAKDQLLRLAACQVKDASGNADYAGTGISPDYIATPLSPISGILPFGNPEENMLSVALKVINGEMEEEEETQN